MDYAKELRKFINSQYLYYGIRVTAAAMIPAVILYRLDVLQVTVALPLGALSVSSIDTPGPLHHRRNSLIASIFINFFVLLLTGLLNTHAGFVIAEIIVFGTFFSLIGVYGNRVSSIGLIALFAFIFYVDNHVSRHQTFLNTLWFTVGGIWYLVLSLFLHTLRPFKLIQQLLGESLIETSNYLKVKGAFYQASPDYEALYKQLFHYQVLIKQHHDDLREMIFKTRKVIDESTVRGRTVMLIFLDSIDLFERIITSQQDYEKLHKDFNSTGILEKYYSYIIMLAARLEEIGIAVQSGWALKPDTELDDAMEQLTSEHMQLRDDNLTADNIENYITLRQILYSLQDLTERIRRLENATTYDKQLSKSYKQEEAKVENSVTRQEIDPKLIVENLTLKSGQFRHAVRITLALLTGYIISLLYPLGHGYWILLTIAVIMKPAYSITAKRNRQRVAGTICGAAAGFAILYFSTHTNLNFILMMFAMIMAYSFIRTNYFIGSAFVTLYVLISINFLSSSHFTVVLADRVIDTIIGSVIAYLFSNFVLPSWEHEQINSYVDEALVANRNYFNSVAQIFTGNNANASDFKLHRKNAFVALANLSDTFQRMLSEPKNRQTNMQLYHQFVSSSHMLTSYIASLSYYAQRSGKQYASEEFLPLIRQVDRQFETAIDVHQHHKHIDELPQTNALPISKRVKDLLTARREEINTGKQTSNAAARKTLSDLKTITSQFDLINTITIDEIRILEKINA